MPVGNGRSGQPIHYWRLDAGTSFAGHVYVCSLLGHERGMNRSRLCHFTFVSKHSLERVIFVSCHGYVVCCMLLCLGHCRWGLTRASIFEFRSSIVCSSGPQLDVNRWYFNDLFPRQPTCAAVLWKRTFFFQTWLWRPKIGSYLCQARTSKVMSAKSEPQTSPNGHGIPWWALLCGLKIKTVPSIEQRR